MTDRELLELAAKAAGVQLRDLDDRYDRWESDPVLIHRGWNPLTDDGDALRLAVKLQIIVGKYDDYANAGGIGNDVDVVVWAHEEKDPYAATRRAIVRAAAEIGKGMT
jgi:hypothetical protein